MMMPRLLAGASIPPLLVAMSLLACSARKGLADIRLPTLATSDSVPIAKCPTPKCLTVYVAPWCPYCRASSELIGALREHLKPKQVTTRIVVGMDDQDAVAQYAAEFGPDTLLDPGGKIKVNGVPHFIVSDVSGQILSSRGGIPLVPRPWTPELLDEVLRTFGLP